MTDVCGAVTAVGPTAVTRSHVANHMCYRLVYYLLAFCCNTCHEHNKVPQ